MSRLPGGRARVVDARGATEIAITDFADLVRAREAGDDTLRWVWDDTVRWYPALLEAGVRVRRCADLRLGHQILMRAPAVDPRHLEGPQAGAWHGLAAAEHDAADSADLGLFAVDDPNALLDASLEDARQVAAIAASAESGKLALLLAAESSGALVAAEIRHAGVPWRSDVHERFLDDVLGPRPRFDARPVKLEAMVAEVARILDAPRLNPDSRPELLAALRRQGVDVPDTRKWTLAEVQHPAIEPLLRYRAAATLFQNNGWAWSEEWVRGGRFRPAYQVSGSATGRWSSNGGGALSFPAQIRPAVIADEGWRLVVADVAQLEPRVLAGMSGDAALARSARGADLYQGMVDDGAVSSRDHAKLGLLGAMYGATSGESGRLVPALRARYPQAFALVERAADVGERGGVVRTLLGRGSPDPGDSLDVDPRGAMLAPESSGQLRRAHGRFTRNFVVQGTGAEWASCWLGDLRNRLWQLGERAGLGDRVENRPHLVFFLHDEVVIHTPVGLVAEVEREVRAAAETAAGLIFREAPIDFPLTVADVACYADAK